MTGNHLSCSIFPSPSHEDKAFEHVHLPTYKGSIRTWNQLFKRMQYLYNNSQMGLVDTLMKEFSYRVFKSTWGFILGKMMCHITIFIILIMFSLFCVFWCVFFFLTMFLNLFIRYSTCFFMIWIRLVNVDFAFSVSCWEWVFLGFCCCYRDMVREHIIR